MNLSVTKARKPPSAQTLKKTEGTCETPKHFGVLPGMFYRASTGPMIRESQRHLVQWTLEPIAALIAEEASEKLGSPVRLDVARPLQAFDTGGRGRALGAIVKAAAEAKAAGVTDEFSKALSLVDWK